MSSQDSIDQHGVTLDLFAPLEQYMELQQQQQQQHHHHHHQQWRIDVINAGALSLILNVLAHYDVKASDANYDAAEQAIITSCIKLLHSILIEYQPHQQPSTTTQRAVELAMRTMAFDLIVALRYTPVAAISEHLFELLVHVMRNEHLHSTCDAKRSITHAVTHASLIWREAYHFQSIAQRFIGNATTEHFVCVATLTHSLTHSLTYSMCVLHAA
jgi:hypothetical protein